jgi:transcriptional regulator with XRE-family HTH domain
MTTRNRRLDRAIAVSKSIASDASREIRDTRVAIGLSQDDVGRAVGMSGSQVGRFERGELEDIGLRQLCRLSVAVGLVPSVRLYPAGDPIRDVAQVRLLERIRGRLPSASGWRTEVPLHGRSDARAWDAVARSGDCLDAFEAETRLGDLQAIDRRIALKLRDDPDHRPRLPGRRRDTRESARACSWARVAAGQLPARHPRGARRSVPWRVPRRERAAVHLT